MNMIKSLILGSAAGIVALSGAQAADLPLKAKAVEYVKVCSLYGAGFYYIPGTDTCIKLGGYLRVDTTFHGQGAYSMPAWSAPWTRASNEYIGRARQDINIDTRTATEYGVVRTYFDATFNWTTGSDGRAAGNLGVYYAFIQFAGFTMGKAVSQFSSPWTGYPGNNTSFLLGGQDDVTGVNQIAYTAQFGNGVSAAISLEDASGNGSTLTSYNRAQLLDLSLGGLTDNWAGSSVPDIVGQIRVDQAWGLFQFSAAAHQLRALNYVGNVTSHPGDAWGFAVQAALSLKNLPTGAGDSINVSVGYSDGASRYVIGGVSPDNYQIFGNGNSSVARLMSTDGVYGLNGSIEKTQEWGVRGAFNHNWDAYWSSSLFGAYTQVRYNNAARALLQGTTFCNGLTVCDPNANISQVGTVLRWTPVKNLTFSGEALYTHIDQKSVTPVNAPIAAGSQGTWTFGLRAQRTF